jgi:RND superfamily putative drug exporter
VHSLPFRGGARWSRPAALPRGVRGSPQRRVRGSRAARAAARGLRHRRSWGALVAWAFAIVALALLGRGIDARLSPMTLTVPGSPSAQAEAMLRSKFGNTVPIAILLKGPQRQLAAQGTSVVHALRGLPDVQVLAPFDTGMTMAAATMHSLRPSSDAALVLVNFIRPASASMATAPETERILARSIRPPVRSYLTGVAVIGHALQDATLADTERASLLALPALIIVLLLVFRSPVAAALPLLMGGATVTAGHGLLWLTSFVTPINSLGVAVAAMMSLALGVDYALLMVSRMRQELAAGRDAHAAVAVARRSAGRTIAAAGGTLALTMLAASWVATPGLLGPVAIGVVISGLLSVALALTAMPALLHLAGARINRWQIRLPGRRSARQPARATRLAERLIAHPALTVPLILAAMLLLASPAGALRMGPPDASELPASNPARQAVRVLERTIGPGWSAPFVIVASARSGPITTSARIDALARWQEALAREPDVAAVLGPASVAGAQHELAEAHAALASGPRQLASAHGGIEALNAGLHGASDAVESLRSGLAAAAAGARSLATGAAGAGNGAQLIAGQTDRARSGAQELATQTGRARAGAQLLAHEGDRARAGANRLAAEDRRAQAGSSGLEGGLSQAAAASQRLAQGIDEAGAGAERLAASDHELAGGAAELAQGMNELDATVHTIAAPLELLGEQLKAWSSLIGVLREHEQLVGAQLAHALRELEAMSVGRGDPHYAALTQALAGLRQALESSGVAQLGAVGARLGRALEQIEALPGQLTQLIASLDRLTAGANRLAAGTRESEAGAVQLSQALHTLAAGEHGLNEGLTQLGGGAGLLSGGLGGLAAGDERLAAGIGRLAAGNGRLAGGLGSLAAGTSRLVRGLAGITAGTGRLASGLDRLAGGATALSGGLAAAHRGSARLAQGLNASRGPLGRYAATLAHYEQEYRLLRTDAPNTLRSGYLVLSALDGTVPPVREQVAQLVNVNGGGQTARLVVVADSAPSSRATAALSARLRRTLPKLAAATGSEVQIGQGAQYLLDYQNANTARFPWLVAALAIVAVLTLVVVLRALLLPLIAVALNMATIAVALGVLEWLTHQHLLGGPGYIDAASGAGIVAIMFVLSIDYEVFLLTRMREEWVAGHDHRRAISYGLRHTAGVITGSAAIMTAVFVAFAGASDVPLSEFGVGLTIAVLLDATVVRLLLLPALMRALGERVWWLPSRARPSPAGS